MIYTVTFNPSIDYIVSVEDLKLGRVNRTRTEKVLPGGKGINVSWVLQNLGHDSIALGFLAGFTGREIERLVADKGIRTDFLYVDKGISRMNVKLHSVQDAGANDGSVCEETEINGQGPRMGEADVRHLYEQLDRLEQGDTLVLAGSIPGTLPDSIYRDILERLKEKELRIVVDATKELLLGVLPYHPFLIKPNHHELGEIFQVTPQNKEEVILYARKLQEMGARNVLVSMAGDGAVLVAEDGSICQREAPKGKVVNAVGAGDSMVAGFLAGFLETGSYEEAFRMGVCAGSASAFSEELATKEEVLALMKA